MKNRLSAIMQLGIPIILAMLSQSLINLIDAALVGPLGDEALAAVGVGSQANFVALSLLAGLSAAIQAQVARRAGEGKWQLCAVPVNHGILIAFFFALPLSLLLVVLAPWLLLLFNTGTLSIHDNATLYFQIRVMALTAAAMNLSFRGFWNGIGNPKVFLVLLIITHMANALISYALIYGKLGLPSMGVPGAALGTFFSMYIGALLNLWMLFRRTPHQGFLNNWGTRESMVRTISLAVPDSLQQTLFALGILLFFAIVSRLGVKEMAIAHVLMNIALVLILPGVGLGMTANTLVSQCLGARKPEKAWRWGQDVMYVAYIMLLIFSLPLILFPQQVLSLFLYEPELLTMGAVPLQLTGLGLVLDAPTLVFTQALLGAGANRTVLCIRFVAQWLILLPLSWLAGPFLGLGLTVVWIMPTLQRALCSLSFFIVWQSRRWNKIVI